jgi:O-acetyl-ADP-ribose deacetylase (regulator of RNase III)
MIDVRNDDLLTADVECVVRAVGSNLEPVTSLGRAVGAAAGADLEERIERMGELPVWGAVITPGGALRADFLVHVVVQSSEEPVTMSGVRKALVNGLRHACRLGVETMALPPLGTGAGNLDAEGAADVMIPVLREHLEREDYPKQVVVMVTTAYEEQAFGALFPNYDTDNMAEIPTSFGGLVFMMAAVSYLGGVVILLAWPVYRFLQAGFETPGGSAGILPLVLGASGAIALTAACIVFPLRAGVNRVRQLER